METRVLLLALSMLAVALAGCADDTDGPISVVGMPADPKTEPVRLESTVSADEYQWKMGDGREPLTGQSIEHVYGVTDGTFRVELTTVSGGEETVHAPLVLTFGSGTNSAPELLLQLESNWVQAGQEVTFSAQGSSDPEGDPILTQWFCQRQGDIAVATGGHHGGGAGGVQFGTGAAAAFPVELLNGTAAPSADRTVEGDFCTNMSGSGFADETAIRGAFDEAGIYEVTLAAKDPANPNVASATTIYVTDFPVPNPVVNHTFSDTITYGAPANADDLATQAEQTEHIRTHDFEIEYPILSVIAELSHDGGTSGEGVDIQFALVKGGSAKHGPTAEPLDKGAGFLSPGDYTAWVYLRTGANVEYTLDVTYVYETDPAKLFEAPH